MTLAVSLSPTAQRQLRKLDPPARRRVQAAIDLVARDPRPPRSVQLVGGVGEWRVRTGDLRIIYEIDDGSVVVVVLRVGRRREIYRRS